ncbi:META domain-containing protein [Methanoregula sp.]|uniref:META domain-containing protein n=1 Tax=Methanoregula sp. TaxID=2052170 RepID=UPI003BAF803B
MDDDHLESGTPGPVPAESVPVPAAPMGRGFWAAMILIGVLILLIIYAQVQGVTRSIPVNLTGTSWTLTYYESSGETMVPVMNGTKVNISFGLDNGTSLGGYSGCNWYRSQYTISNFTLSLTKEVTTGTTCAEPGVMQLESEYMQDLRNTSGIRFRSGHLFFYDTADRPLLIFEQKTS